MATRPALSYIGVYSTDRDSWIDRVSNAETIALHSPKQAVVAIFMSDTLTPGERSERMSRIRGTSTKPEIVVRHHLHALGFRYRLHVAALPGRPDLVLPRHDVVIFVHGCFWHAHGCQKGRIPATRSQFWQDKFAANRARDARHARKLRRLGWRVIVVWECSLARSSTRQATLDILASKIFTPYS